MLKTKKTNYLILIGGGEDKRGEKKLLRSVLEKTKAKKILLIPSASSYPREVAENYYEAFGKLGVRDVESLDIRYADEADRTEYYEKVQQADLVYFTGGDQVRLVDILGKTRLFELIKNNYLSGKLHIAGTSAGAAAASTIMLYDGDYEGFNKGSINYSKGFDLLPDITIDTHFITRNRISRLSQFLMTGQTKRGIGLAEDTGIAIARNLQFQVIGTGMVTLLNSKYLSYSNYDKIRAEEYFSANNLRLGFLAPQTNFSIKRWVVLRS